jgi:hypothetical protein
VPKICEKLDNNEGVDDGNRGNDPSDGNRGNSVDRPDVDHEPSICGGYNGIPSALNGISYCAAITYIKQLMHAVTVFIICVLSVKVVLHC